MRGLRRLLRRYRLRETEECIPAGDAGAGEATPVDVARLFDPQDSAFVDDPYPMFAYLREEAPVHRGASGAWVLSRYEDVANALVDERLGNAPSRYATVNRRNRDKYLSAGVANNILPFLDPPEHDAPRQFITRQFHRYLASNAPPLDELATNLLTDVCPRGEFDFLEDFATPYSARVFCRLFGLGEERVPEILEWSDWFFYLLTVIPSQHARMQIDHALEQLRGYFSSAIEYREANPGKDFISRLLSANREQSVLGREQLVDNLILLFADGVGNVDKGLCAAAALLLAHPEQRDSLVRQPELLPRAVDECLRYESPAQFIGRVALEDLEIRGQRIRRDEAVLLLLGSANRDPEQFAAADRFDITRFPNPHLSFGRSRHACVGGMLVRQEIQAGIEALLRNLPGARLAEQRLEWQLRMGHRWLARLPVVDAANAAASKTGIDS